MLYIKTKIIKKLKIKLINKFKKYFFLKNVLKNKKIKLENITNIKGSKIRNISKLNI